MQQCLKCNAHILTISSYLINTMYCVLLWVVLWAFIHEIYSVQGIFVCKPFSWQINAMLICCQTFLAVVVFYRNIRKGKCKKQKIISIFELQINSTFPGYPALLYSFFVILLKSNFSSQFSWHINCTAQHAAICH